jgi:hypothetical protein
MLLQFLLYSLYSVSFMIFVILVYDILIIFSKMNSKGTPLVTAECKRDSITR